MSTSHLFFIHTLLDTNYYLIEATHVNLYIIKNGLIKDEKIKLKILNSTVQSLAL